jgi:hypothetical protein
MDYVYICRSGDNEELRYSLRSLLKNAPDGRVWLVGGKPEWYIGDFIPVRGTSHKYNNARNNLSRVVSSNDISEEFVLMNDDFFIVKPVDSIVTYYGGLLTDKINRYKQQPGAGAYNSLLMATYKAMRKRGINAPLDYELHMPMAMTKTGLSVALETNVLWRSAYGNLFRVGGQQSTDVKYYGSSSKRVGYAPGGESPYLSSEDNAFNELLPMLEKQFDEPSRYETI